MTGKQGKKARVLQTGGSELLSSKTVLLLPSGGCPNRGYERGVSSPR